MAPNQTSVALPGKRGRSPADWPDLAETSLSDDENRASASVAPARGSSSFPCIFVVNSYQQPEDSAEAPD